MENESLNLTLIEKSDIKILYFIEDSNYKIKGILKIIKSEDKDLINIIVNFNNYYEGEYLIDDFKIMDCFKFSSENLDEIFKLIFDLIDNNNFELFHNNYNDKFILIFNAEFIRKKLTSKFELSIKETFDNNQNYFECKKLLDTINDLKSELKIKNVKEKDLLDKLDKKNKDILIKLENKNKEYVILLENKNKIDKVQNNILSHISDNSSLMNYDYINYFTKWSKGRFL